MKLRQMKMEDLKQIAALEAELFTEPWNEEDFRREMEENEFCEIT